MRVAPPDLPGAQTTDSPIDRALALLLANETEAALRWAAAAVEHAPSMPSALVITCRLLEQMGRPAAGADDARRAVRDAHLREGREARDAGPGGDGAAPGRVRAGRCGHARQRRV